MRILAITNIYPTPHFPTSGTFIEQQIKGLRQIGLNVRLMFVDRVQEGMGVYRRLRPLIQTNVTDFQPEIVHVMYGGVLADITTRVVHDIPTIVSFCGSDLLGEPLSGLFRKLIAGYGVLASHRAAKRASGIVVKSRNLMDALPYTVPRSKVVIIPNGVNLELFKPLDQGIAREMLGWDKHRFHVLFPANCLGDPRKRFDLAQATIKAANRLGIQGELHQLIGVAHDKVPVWLNASDAVLLTSMQEGSPNIIKEALACNVPIVSVDVGDVSDRIQAIEGCYLAMAKPSELADKLCLVHDGSCRVQGRTTMKTLSLKWVAKRLKEFYEEVLISYEKESNY